MMTDVGGHICWELKAHGHLNLILGDRFERVVSVSANALVDRQQEEVPASAAWQSVEAGSSHAAIQARMSCAAEYHCDTTGTA